MIEDLTILPPSIFAQPKANPRNGFHDRQILALFWLLVWLPAFWPGCWSSAWSHFYVRRTYIDRPRRLLLGRLQLKKVDCQYPGNQGKNKPKFNACKPHCIWEHFSSMSSPQFTTVLSLTSSDSFFCVNSKACTFLSHLLFWILNQFGRFGCVLTSVWFGIALNFADRDALCPSFFSNDLQSTRFFQGLCITPYSRTFWAT